MPSTEHTRRRLGIGAVAVGVVAAHAAAAVFFAGRNPYTSEILPPCPILHLTGWQCPGCGGTRSAYSLLHGDLLGALAMNPIVPALYVAAVLLGAGVLLRTRRPLLSDVLQYAAPVVVVAAVVWSALVRNLF